MSFRRDLKYIVIDKQSDTENYKTTMTERRTQLNILIVIVRERICHLSSDRAGLDGMDDEQITLIPDTFLFRSLGSGPTFAGYP